MPNRPWRRMEVNILSATALECCEKLHKRGHGSAPPVGSTPVVVDTVHTYDIGIATDGDVVDRADNVSNHRMIMSSGKTMSSSKHKRKLAAALKKMGTSLATHTESTFKPSGVASRTLDEFKARRAAEKLGLLAPKTPKVIERYEIDAETAQVTKLPVRAKTR